MVSININEINIKLVLCGEIRYIAMVAFSKLILWLWTSGAMAVSMKS